MAWIKIQTDFLDDERIQAAIGVSPFASIVALWSLLKAGDNRGPVVRISEITIRGAARKLNFGEEEIAKCLEALAEVEFLVRSRDDIRIVQWEKHQSPFMKRNSREQAVATPAPPKKPAPEKPKAPVSPPVEGIEPFPCKGTIKEWVLTEAKLAEYVDLYPGLDVLQFIKKLRQWAVDTPAKRKTAKGMPSFLGRNIGRENDKPQQSSGMRSASESQRQEPDKPNRGYGQWPHKFKGHVEPEEADDAE